MKREREREGGGRGKDSDVKSTRASRLCLARAGSPERQEMKTIDLHPVDTNERKEPPHLAPRVSSLLPRDPRIGAQIEMQIAPVRSADRAAGQLSILGSILGCSAELSSILRTVSFRVTHYACVRASARCRKYPLGAHTLAPLSRSRARAGDAFVCRLRVRASADSRRRLRSEPSMINRAEQFTKRNAALDSI